MTATIDAAGRILPSVVGLDVLTEKFPPSAIKRFKGRGGKTFDYVQGHSIINRLNHATGNHWDFSVLRLWQEGKILFAHVRLELPGLGAREHIGVQMVEGGGEDIAKGAVTDALKKAATLFGVAIELYGDDYEDADDAQEGYERNSRPTSPQPDGSPPQSDVNRNAFLNVLLREAKARDLPITAAMKPAQIAEVLHKRGGTALLQPGTDGKYDKEAMLALVRSIPARTEMPDVDEHEGDF